MFHSIPLWIHSSSLEAITHLSHSSTLRGLVRHIVFSTIRVVHAKNEKVYLSEVKRELEVHTDSVSLVALNYGQHIKAYHAAFEDQKYLKKGGLQVRVLARAFRAFPNLKEVTIEDRNYGIGSRQLLRDFGAFKTADILTCNGVDTVPSLIKALSDADVQLSGLRIGSQDYIEPSCYTPSFFSFGRSRPSYPRQLGSKAMSIAFCGPETRTYTERVLQQLQRLEIFELGVEDDRSDLLKMAMAIRTLITSAPNLWRVNIMEISWNNGIDMQALSVEDLFSSHVRHHNLTCVILIGLIITNHLTLVSFIKLHARSLGAVDFIYFELADVK